MDRPLIHPDVIENIGKSIRGHIFQHRDKLHDEKLRLQDWIQRKANGIVDPQQMVKFEKFGEKKSKELQDKIDELHNHLLKDNKDLLEPYGVPRPVYKDQGDIVLRHIHRHMNKHFGRTL